jgi:peptidyl-prolyl cis-trans isomerase SurA
MYRIGFFLTLVFLTCAVHAQKLEDKTLLTIDGKNYDAGTFMRVYGKNLDIVKDESQKDIDNYVELYIDYRLKLMQAYELKLDAQEVYKKELLNHRTTLAQGYLTDNQVTDALVQEAYARSSQELKGKHILVTVEPNALPQDTLTAWNSIQEIKQELDNGADFATLAKSKSQDPGAGNGGDLGWFGPFKMVYEFETAAYNTTKGSYSIPFRTDFGYHIVKIEDARAARGEVTVAHIMTFDEQEATEKTAAKRIQDINKQLIEGGKFEQLAREFSDDLNSANQGGKLNRFGTGGLNSAAFEDIAFGLISKEQISQPFESEYGWHIVKLVEKHPLQSFAELQKPLAEKIKKSPRARRITAAFTDKLKMQYKAVINDMELNSIVSNVSDSVLEGTWVNTKNFKNYKSQLITMNGASWTAGDFYEYIETQQKKDFNPYKTKQAKIKAAFDGYLESNLIDFYDKNLERDNKDFSFVYNEYKEGILLFNLLDKSIWNRAKEDSLGQQNYFNSHKGKYVWKRRLDLVLTQNTTEDAANEVKGMLKNKTPLQDIKDALNTDGRTKVMISSGTVEENYNRLPDNFNVQLGVSEVYGDPTTNFYKVIEVKDIIEPKPKTLDEARGSVINDYQQQLEKDWLGNLRDGHSIKVDKKVLAEVKDKLKMRE